MIERYRDGPSRRRRSTRRWRRATTRSPASTRSCPELLDGVELTQALEAIWSRVRRLNRYVEESRPWDLAKDESQSGRLDQVLYNLAEGIRVLALLLAAYMPETSERLLDALGEPDRDLDGFGARGGGAAVERIAPLFPKLD